jgi:hypothetical protein
MAQIIEDAAGRSQELLEIGGDFRALLLERPDARGQMSEGRSDALGRGEKGSAPVVASLGHAFHRVW